MAGTWAIKQAREGAGSAHLGYNSAKRRISIVFESFVSLYTARKKSGTKKGGQQHTTRREQTQRRARSITAAISSSPRVRSGLSSSSRPP